MPRKRLKKESTFADEVIHSLTDFKQSIARNESITIRKVKLDLQPPAFDASSIQHLRSELGVSQALFAELIAVSVDLIRKWEAGTRKPAPVHCRLLREVAIAPRKWLRRIVKEAESNQRRVSA